MSRYQYIKGATNEENKAFSLLKEELCTKDTRVI